MTTTAELPTTPHTIAAPLHVESHVSRDLLQSAELFKTEQHVIWEYVANGLQYNTSALPEVKIQLGKSKPASIIIQDNGKGMNLTDLRHFFTMHGENRERATGQKGRGRFGTGKCAAFGIAGTLQVDSVCKGRHYSVRLTREHILSCGGKSIPVETVDSGTPTKAPNGTTITIGEIFLPTLSLKTIQRFIERHMAHWPKRVRVTLNNQICEFHEPEISLKQVFLGNDYPQLPLLKDHKLTIKVAKKPVHQQIQGIAIYADSVWVANSNGGLTNKDMINYLFGDIDVPTLDNNNSQIAAFDSSRSLQLNPKLPMVQQLEAFISQCLEKVRLELVKEKRKLERDVKLRSLNDSASRMAEALNQACHEIYEQLPAIKNTLAGKGSRLLPDPKGTETVGGEGKPKGPRRTPGSNKSTPANAGTKKASRQPSNKVHRLFDVGFDYQGATNPRASYDRDAHRIIINLDHPQIQFVFKTKGESGEFLRLCYEAAQSEFILALAEELTQADKLLSPSDVLHTFRDASDRISRSLLYLS
jgi:hypothetical protein